jgi:phosphate transport system substrate-binding protein
MSKTAWTTCRAILTLSVWLLSGNALQRREYFKAFSDIDNLIGMIPVVLMIVAAAGATVVIWTGRSRRFAPLWATALSLVVLSVAFFPAALRGDWWVNMVLPEGSEASPDLAAYAPFSPNSKTAKLDEAPALTLREDLPRLDGATALYPVYAALAEAVYDKESFSPSDVACTRTIRAYQALTSGERDIIFVAMASAEQLAQAKEAGRDLRFTPIGREAFVFLAADNNPVDSLSYQQIRNVYSGKTAYWKTLGWPEGGRIIAFQRPEGSGSQTGLQKLMSGLPIQTPQPLPSDANLIGAHSLMKEMSMERHGKRPALGYSYRYFAVTMFPNPEAKMLKINGVAPSMENIRNGEYPFVADFYAVTDGEPKGNVKLFIDWMLSPQGQTIIEKTGYAPIKRAVDP